MTDLSNLLSWHRVGGGFQQWNTAIEQAANGTGAAPIGPLLDNGAACVPLLSGNLSQGQALVVVELLSRLVAACARHGVDLEDSRLNPVFDCLTRVKEEHPEIGTRTAHCYLFDPEQVMEHGADPSVGMNSSFFYLNGEGVFAGEQEFVRANYEGTVAFRQAAEALTAVVEAGLDDPETVARLAVAEAAFRGIERAMLSIAADTGTIDPRFFYDVERAYLKTVKARGIEFRGLDAGDMAWAAICDRAMGFRGGERRPITAEGYWDHHRGIIPKLLPEQRPLLEGWVADEDLGNSLLDLLVGRNKLWVERSALAAKVAEAGRIEIARAMLRVYTACVDAFMAHEGLVQTYIHQAAAAARRGGDDSAEAPPPDMAKQATGGQPLEEAANRVRMRVESPEWRMLEQVIGVLDAAGDPVG